MSFKFFFLGSLPRNERNLKGTLLTAMRMAKQLDPSINQVLIKGFAHTSTVRTKTGEIVPAPLHYTFHFKTPQLAAASKHWSAHADVKLDPKNNLPRNWWDTNLLPKHDPTDEKTLVADPDEYYDEKKQAWWNKWDVKKNQITIFTEKDIEGWFIGEQFIAYPPEEAKKVPPHAAPSNVVEEVKEDQEKSKKATELMIVEDAVVKS